MLTPLISIVIPFRDRFALLFETVESVKNQTYKNQEIILVDDASGIDIVPTLEDKLKGFEFKYFKNKTCLGPGGSRQKGLEFSTGKFLVYLDSDDILHPQMIQKCVDLMEGEPGVGMCYVTSLEFSKSEDLREPEKLKIRKRSNQHIADNLIIEILEKRRIWDTSACVWRKEAVKSFSPWMENFQMEDYAYDIQIQTAGLKIKNIPESLCYYRKHADSFGNVSRNEVPVDQLYMLINTSNHVFNSVHIGNKDKVKIQKIIIRQILKIFSANFNEYEKDFPTPLNAWVKLLVKSKIFRGSFCAKMLQRFPIFEVI